MKIINKLKVYIILFILYFPFSLTGAIPKVTITIDENAWAVFRYFSFEDDSFKEEKKKIETYIIKNIENAFSIAWERYENAKKNNLVSNINGKPTIEIVKALDNLKSEKNIKINFLFDDEYYWHYAAKIYGNKFEILGEKDGSGAAHIPLDIYGFKKKSTEIDILNIYRQVSIRKKYRKKYRGCDYFIQFPFLMFENDYEKGGYGTYTTWNKRKNVIIDTNNQKVKWEPAGVMKESLASIMFHELVHIALYNHKYTREINRQHDEATIEDITKKVFSESSNFPLMQGYELEYSYGVWAWRNRDKLPQDYNDFFWYDDPFIHTRDFNPPDTLKYKRVDKKIDIFKNIIISIDDKKFLKSLSHIEDVNADDCNVDKELYASGRTTVPAYVIPYNICCDKTECEPDPPQEVNDGSGKVPDNADDNYSYSDGNVEIFNLAPEAIIFTHGNWKDALKLYGGLIYDGENTAQQLFEATPFLIVPSGGLYGKEHDEVFKKILEDYIYMGGTVVFFSQQFGSQWDQVLPVPEGETLKTFGWREDQSCLRNSVYFNGIHPVVSSQTKELCNVGVDGYIEAYPSSSTVILNRITNNKPALLYYPYGNGHVVITSMFTDWASAHGQMSNDELKIVRDLITFAKGVKTPIPMFDMAQNPTPEIALGVKVKNDTEHSAATVKLTAYTPDRKTKLYEAEHSAAILADGEAIIPITFTLPELLSEDYGICHVDFELHDAGNETKEKKYV